MVLFGYCCRVKKYSYGCTYFTTAVQLIRHPHMFLYHSLPHKLKQQEFKLTNGLRNIYSAALKQSWRLNPLFVSDL